MNTTGDSPLFWMSGRLATGVLEISHNPASLEEDGFWAIQVDYEGRWTLVKFQNVEIEDFPPSPWDGISTPWNSSQKKNEYIDYVSRMRDAIAQGDIYQVNACRILSTTRAPSLRGLFKKILTENPAPYASYLGVGDIEIASASPELFLSLRTSSEGIQIQSSPIKGTSVNQSFGEKDQSENVMIVDLIRNDLSRICEAGTVDVSRLLGVEKHPGLFHLVSDVVGRLKSDFSWRTFSDAMLPAGSISGAPKSSAKKYIALNEGVRGPYCGLLGWIEKRGAVITGEISVGIRIFWQDEKEVHFGTGAGITWGSDPVEEWEETELKARRLMTIAKGEVAL